MVHDYGEPSMRVVDDVKLCCWCNEFSRVVSAGSSVFEAGVEVADCCHGR